MVEQNSSSGYSPSQSAPLSSNDSKKWPDFSISVNSLLDKLETIQGGADVFEVVNIVREIHPEYGENYNSSANTQGTNAVGNLIQFLQQKRTQLSLIKITSPVWASEVKSIVTKPQKPSVINGRLFLIATILWQFPGIYTQLNQDRMWQNLCLLLISQLDAELKTQEKTDYKSVLTETGQGLLQTIQNPLSKVPLRDNVMFINNLSDVPIKEDSLSRRALATYLVNRLRVIYNRDIDEGGYGAFFMNLDGEWGSGKSTLLGFMKEDLEKRGLIPDIDSKRKSQREWTVVKFNAWENQRLDPPWWFLMKTVYRESMSKLKRTNWQKWLRITLNEFAWRLNAGNNYLKIAALLTLIIFGWALKSKTFTVEGFEGLGIVKVATLLGFIWSFAKLVSSSLLPGSAKAANSFVEENSKDPMNELAEHFDKMIRRIDDPIAIFIDDLDRCNKDYGIRLLEGLQTIFKRAPVVYVIAADRKWLKTMYEEQYSMFAPAIAKPGKPFGLVFLDKIFQLIVELPDISAIQKKIYWNKLLKINDPKQPRLSDAEKTVIENNVASGANNGDKLRIADQTSNSTAGKQFAKEVAVKTFSILEEERILEEKLEKFIELIQPNPRSMKRLINDIGTASTITYLYEQDIDTDQLILWTILKQEHPLLADYFWKNPAKIKDVNSYFDIANPFTGVKEYDELLLRDNVKQLFSYQINGETLKLDIAFLDKMKFKTNQAAQA